MTARQKNAIYTLLLILSVAAVWFYRAETGKNTWRQEIGGSTMGTSYSVVYFGEMSPQIVKQGVDSVLIKFNESLNTWLPDSEISRFNSDSIFDFDLPFFLPVLKASDQVFKRTNGAFDPTVMPLVNTWGFGPGKELVPDSSYIDSLLLITGFEKIIISQDRVEKTDPRVQLDFSAIAKGYGVDVVSEYLLSLGLENHFVEIGGEVFCKGKNLASDIPWRVGITDPRSTLDQFSMIATMSVENHAVATSGNYYNYRIRDGKRFSHTINPETGYPIEREILSATVVAGNCMEADAYATSFMVMGHERAIEIIENDPQLRAVLFYSGENGEIENYISPGLEEKVNFTGN